MIDLSGISIPIATPFRDEHLDHERLRENLAHWRKFNLRAFVLLGSTGEGIALSDREKKHFVATATGFIAGYRPVIIGAAFQSTAQTIQFLKTGIDMGAAAALVLPPFYFSSLMTPATIKKFYFDIADAVDIPIIIYHFPKITGLAFTPEFVLDLAQHPQIIGIKDSSANLIFQQAILANKPDHFQVLTGSASTLALSFQAGAAGAIVALANIAPQHCIDIYHFAKEGDWQRAGKLQKKLILLNTLVTGTYGIPGLKYALDKIGLYGGPARAPLLPVNDDAKKEIDGELQKLGLIE